ncbi:glycosyltransferase family 2 protein [Campylobacter pinnipediorum]|uniref:glycosyltransferase family 2 protein n=1 Tax=Campylobacter pinnipediorum TaxID=1965231 RepID=UPI00084DEA6D|nr:glycosyltransferase family 2 protein [Campylobacter pinnipediorum]AQW82764.1 GalNAc5-diNAcBac-PP-undecaprenol beta-1,3-glucosyltransferase [Campylobacter pinnipediorum subsp. pinnipediorum]
MNDSKDIKVSIIIPTFNRKDLFELALKSAINQDYNNKEIIISDDNSTDGTRQLALKYTNDFDFIKYCVNEKYEKGPNGNKNNGFDNANGDAFVILDDDDLLLPGAISKMVSVLKMGYDSVWANCYFEINGTRTTDFSGFGLDKSQEINPQDYYDGRINGEFLIMFMSYCIGDKRFEKGLYGSENTLWIHLFDFKAYYLNEAVRIYRFHRQDSVTLNSHQRPHCVMKGYAMTAELIMQKTTKIDKRYIAILYKMAGYYAKFAGEYIKMYKYLFYSLSFKLTKEAFIMLILTPFPKKLILFLTKIRVKMYNKKNEK